MEKKIRKIINTAKYGDETWQDVMLRVNKDGGVDLKLLYLIMGVILDELERINTPFIPTVFSPANEKVKQKSKK